eukprot:superscaffoldBa00001002_g8469
MCKSVSHLGKKLSRQPFYTVSGKIYCEDDFLVLLGVCVHHQVLQAHGKSYHPSCFRCVICRQSLEGLPFTVDTDSRIYCVSDYHKVQAPRCAACRMPILPTEKLQWKLPNEDKTLIEMASVTVTLRGWVFATVSLLNFAFVFISGADFIRFISFRAIYHNITGETILCQDSIPWSVALRDSSVLKSLVVDLGLLALFTAQHSLLAWSPVKQACQSVLGALNRTVYCFTTALALQVYYECLGLGDPLSYKSPRAQRLLSHLRHPVCLELGVVLWLLPALSLDRLLLALTLSTYLALAHSLDKQDLAYLCVQLNSKMQIFAEPQRGSADASDQDKSNHKEK